MGKFGRNSSLDVRHEAKVLENILDQALDQTRDLARGLNPVKITPDGLARALQKLAANVSVPAGPHCFCHIPKPVKITDHHVANHLYRIAQEAVQNALRHARAKKVTITLARKENHLVLVVKDDGRGIPIRPKKAGMGLDNMRTRARLVDGKLEIHRQKSGGTAVSCAISQPNGRLP
jgi:signal transduction histidine kinase